MSTTFQDGRSGASSGSAQLPTLLSGYAVRPGWSVAGVDYAVGAAAGATLKDPSSLSMAGVSVNATSHYISVSGNNVVLDGYDFSRNGGWAIYVSGANDVISNSNFKVGANNLVPIASGTSASNLRVLHNTIDGGGVGVAGDPAAIWSLIGYNGTGLTVEYNWLKNAPQHVVEFKSGTLIDRYNLIQNLGFYPEAHVNDVQFNGGVSDGSVISFNTIYKPQPTSSGTPAPGEGLQVEAQLGSTITNVQVENNTVIATGPALTASYLIAIHQDAGNTINGVNVQSNFIDSTGAYGAFYPTPTGSNLAFFDNVNLVTGTGIAGPAGTAASSIRQISASASGTATVGSTVTLTVSLNEAMTVTGTPTLSLNDNGVATYAGGSGTSTLRFSHTVAATNTAVTALRVTGINLPGSATIRDAAGNSANLSTITNAIAGAPAIDVTARATIVATAGLAPDSLSFISASDTTTASPTASLTSTLMTLQLAQADNLAETPDGTGAYVVLPSVSAEASGGIAADFSSNMQYYQRFDHEGGSAAF